VTAPACDGVVTIAGQSAGGLVDAVVALAVGDGSVVAVVANDVGAGVCRPGCVRPGVAWVTMPDPLTGGLIVASRCRWHAVAWVRWLLADPHRSTERIYVEVAGDASE